MASHNGYLTLDLPLEAQTLDDDVAVEGFYYSRRAENYYPGSVTDANDAAISICYGAHVAGSHSYPATSRVGHAANTFLNDFADRIYLFRSDQTYEDLPSMNMGILVSPVTKSFKIFNSYSTAKSLETVTDLVPYGCTHDLTLPLSLVAGGEVAFNIVISLSGVPIFDLDADFKFETPEEHRSINISATRVGLLSYDPSWKDAVKLQREWKNAITFSRTGKEKRSCLSGKFLRSVQFSVTLNSNRERIAFERAMSIFIDRQFVVPHWGVNTKLNAQATAGTSILQVDSIAGLDIRPNDFILLVRTDTGVKETYLVSSTQAAPAQITLYTNLSTTWPVGSYVVPAWLGRIDPDVQMVMPNSLNGQYALQYKEIPDAGVAVASAYTPPVTYKSNPVYMASKFDYSSSPNRGVTKPYDLIEGNAAPPTLVSARTYVTRNLKAKSNFTTAAEFQAITDFFDYCKGAWRGFWVPSWMDDYLLSRNVAAADTSIWVQLQDYVEYAPGTNIMFFDYNTGNYSFRKINSLGSTTATEQNLVLDGAVGYNLDVANSPIVCELRFCRFTEDKLEFNFLEPFMGYVDLAFTEVPFETPA